MAWWITWKQVEGSDPAGPLAKRIELRVVEAEEEPAQALHGPALSERELMVSIHRAFDRDPESGLIYFKSLN